MTRIHRGSRDRVMVFGAQVPPAAAAHAINSEGWLQAGELGPALVLSAANGRGVLRDVLEEATARDFAIDDVATEALGYRRPSAVGAMGARRATDE